MVGTPRTAKNAPMKYPEINEGKNELTQIPLNIGNALTVIIYLKRIMRQRINNAVIVAAIYWSNTNARNN